MRHLGRPGFGDGYLVNVELTGSPKVKIVHIRNILSQL